MKCQVYNTNKGIFTNFGYYFLEILNVQLILSEMT